MALFEEFNNKISSYNRQIWDLQQKIAICERRIEELSQLRNKINVLEDIFQEAHSIRRKRLSQVISELDSVKRYSKNILYSINTGTYELFVGMEYNDAVAGVENSILLISQEIAKLLNEMEVYSNEIISLKHKKSNCKLERELYMREQEERQRKDVVNKWMNGK